MTEDHDVFGAAPLRWPPRADGKPSPTSTPLLYAYVLDEDYDLAEEFDIRARVGVRQRATAKILEADIGECDLGPLFAASHDGIGLLIVAGMAALDTRVGDRTAAELVGVGDLLQPPAELADELVGRSDQCRVLCPTRFALLDAEFASRIGPWPQLIQALLRRASRRISDVNVLRAIAAQPRLEVRLVLLLWHLAARWGRVEPSGIRVSLPLTHRLLGQLVSAERPSISHALHRLAQAGLVTGGAGDLHLHGSLERHLGALVDRTGRIAEPRRQNGRPRRQSVG